ncbi:3-oxoacyl-[acyl-carrier-protein] reductase FabG (plasmid) [Phaeobacter piscinae]|uniref:3-oxoacyl-[acyl-carrier-protein] reductase FabG n=1 Tax=Phaeobacter piscinae TaxID=1580596 RepID=A0ABN5DLH8_9RHOB|nr:SDR family oxidoreductase [Phaeobacter piscinae]ATG37848.1 3-oxoacyl-[acyl-carrier-protein] reductase FabG [Phaeobacter piscinae]AUQ88369.1 3-oxoacyl-[acyl-carrier-protein] reductase FabG [Phaeobacter piscinae]AUR26252.1 3-oxoacyl-[acyl-carrier-protein] reductase FabG [Phaeobacter piscinae]
MKRAIVTGGSGLIGREICAHLLREGWEVASFDLKEGNVGVQIHCDLSSEDSINEAFCKLNWDHLDLLVNNGGLVFETFTQLSETTLDKWKSTLDSHLTGAFMMSRAAQPMLREGGSIIMMASTRALMSEGIDFSYAAAKGGMLALAQALAVQLGPKIRVNTIAPGWITDETDLRDVDNSQHPVGRVGRPADIAETVMYLVSARFVTGETVVVDGGMTKKMIYAE